MAAYDGDPVDVLGVVILTRHGDRKGSYQDPESYNATNTSLTPFGEVQAFSLGTTLRTRYVSRYSNFTVPTLAQNIFNNAQVKFRADASGEGTVMLDTAVAIGQGLYPPTRESNEVLADGSMVISPNNGYQYIAVESVEPDQDVSLEGWTECRKFDEAVKEQLASPAFLAEGKEHAAFLDGLKTFVGDRPHDFANVWNVYDYMSVQYTHNSLFRNQVPASTINEARGLANFHQQKLFSDPDPMHIRNIAGRTVIPDIVENIDKMAILTNPLGMVVLSSSHQPFISLFEMLGVTKNHPEVAGVVNYAAAMSFEVRRPYTVANRTNRDEFVVRVNFKNGTADSNFIPYTMLGRPYGTYDVPLSEFTSTLKQWSVASLSQWCDVCGTSDARGCDLVTRARGGGDQGHRLGPIASGFVGAAIAFVVSAILIGALFFTGLLNWRRTAQRRKSTTSSRLSAIIPGRNKGISPDAESQQQVNDNGFELRDDISVISKTSEKVEHS